MKIEVTPEELAMITKSLRHQGDYLKSQQRDDSSYYRLADRLEREAR